MTEIELAASAYDIAMASEYKAVAVGHIVGEIRAFIATERRIGSSHVEEWMRASKSHEQRASRLDRSVKAHRLKLAKLRKQFVGYVNLTLRSERERDKLMEERHVLGVTPEAAAWVIGKVVEAIDIGPSFRGFIYGLMGFGPESYTPLYLAGGMAFTNAIENAGVDAGVSARKSERAARTWKAVAKKLWKERGKCIEEGTWDND